MTTFELDRRRLTPYARAQLGFLERTHGAKFTRQLIADLDERVRTWHAEGHTRSEILRCVAGCVIEAQEPSDNNLADELRDTEIAFALGIARLTLDALAHHSDFGRSTN